MISVSIHGLTVSGGDEKQFAFALSQVANVAALAKELGAYALPSRPVTTKAGGVDSERRDLCADWLASPLNFSGVQRFRMSRDEIAEHGDGEQARQAAARARMIAGGMEVADVGTATEGVSSADAVADASLSGEFDS